MPLKSLGEHPDFKTSEYGSVQGWGHGGPIIPDKVTGVTLIQHSWRLKR